MLRVPIGSTDFSTRAYTLDDIPNDDVLEHFSLSDEDYTLKVSDLRLVTCFLSFEKYLYQKVHRRSESNAPKLVVT